MPELQTKKELIYMARTHKAVTYYHGDLLFVAQDHRITVKTLINNQYVKSMEFPAAEITSEEDLKEFAQDFEEKFNQKINPDEFNNMLVRAALNISNR